MLTATCVPLTSAIPASAALDGGRGSGIDGQLAVPAYRSELTGIQARTADQRTVNVRLHHYRSDVAGFHRPAIQDTHTCGHFGAVTL
jgi:hypothetical protein